MRLPWQRQSCITTAPCTMLRPAKQRIAPIVYQSKPTGICMDYVPLCAPPVGPPAKPVVASSTRLPVFENCRPSLPPITNGAHKLNKIEKLWINETPVSITEHLVAKTPAVRRKKTDIALVKPPSPKPGSRAAKIQSFIDTHFK